MRWKQQSRTGKDVEAMPGALQAQSQLAGGRGWEDSPMGAGAEPYREKGGRQGWTKSFHPARNMPNGGTNGEHGPAKERKGRLGPRPSLEREKEERWSPPQQGF